MEKDKILEQILNELKGIKDESKETKIEIKKINHKLNLIDNKIDKLEINQKSIIDELSYGFSKVGESQNDILDIKKDVKQIKTSLEHHNLKINL